MHRAWVDPAWLGKEQMWSQIATKGPVSVPAQWEKGQKAKVRLIPESTDDAN